MKKKNEVYVCVDTPKKAKKLKKVLDMFGEEFSTTDGNAIKTGAYEGSGKLYTEFNKAYFTGYNWTLMPTCNGRFAVSIKELRNILAKEHLKEGDVVVVKNSNGKWILKLTGNNIEEFEHSISLEFGTNCLCHFDWTIENGKLIRYATEEEKELLRVKSLQSQAKEVLKPVKKELDVGKWYKSWNDSYNGYDLSYYTGTGTDYGFHYSVYWFSEQYWIKNTMPSEWVEATPQEVEKALIEEAKRRYKVGDKLSQIYEDRSLGNRIFSNILGFQESDNTLWIDCDKGYSSCIFKNGQWATIIEQDKFAELKEAHSNGAVIQIKSQVAPREWEDVKFDCDYWLDGYEYRIKPNYDFTDYDIAIVERLHDALYDNHNYPLQNQLLIDARLLFEKIKNNIK